MGVISSASKVSSLLLFTLTTDALGELHILGHDGHTLGMDSAAIRVLVETDQISFGSLLKGKNGLGLESKILLVLLGNLTDETLERSLLDQEVGTLLVLTDLTQSDGSGAKAVLLSVWANLASFGDDSRFLGEGRAGGLTGTDDLAGGLLSTSHVY